MVCESVTRGSAPALEARQRAPRRTEGEPERSGSGAGPKPAIGRARAFADRPGGAGADLDVSRTGQRSATECARLDQVLRDQPVPEGECDRVRPRPGLKL